jgi:branched-chain amino acid transport system permease protein
VSAAPPRGAPGTGGPARATRWLRPAAAGVALALAAVFPLVVTNQLDSYFAVLTLIYVGAVVAWNLFSGYSGYISLGHAVFFGSGAYAAGLLAQHHSLVGGADFATLPFGGLVGAAVAVPFGLIALRARRHTFVVITIAVFFIFQLMAFNLSFTNGNGGLSPPFLNWDPATVNNPFYYAALAIAVGAITLSWLVRGSRFGLQLLAIRDDEDRAAGLGVRPMRVKLTAFVVSAFITGMLGALWIFFLGQALPETAFDPTFDLTIALMGFIGGFGTLWGPVLGALVLEPLQQELIQRFSNASYLGEIILGGLLLVVIMFLPRGVLPTLGERAASLGARLERRRQPAPGGTAPPPSPPPAHPAVPGPGGAR